MTLCLASHSSFVIGFIAWMRDFCSSVRTGRCPLVRAMLEGHRSVPATSSQEHSTRSLQCLWVSDKPHQGRAAGWPQSSARLVLQCPLIWCPFFYLTATIRAKNSPIYACSSLLLLGVAQRQPLRREESRGLLRAQLCYNTLRGSHEGDRQQLFPTAMF